LPQRSQISNKQAVLAFSAFLRAHATFHHSSVFYLVPSGFGISRCGWIQRQADRYVPLVVKLKNHQFRLAETVLLGANQIKHDTFFGPFLPF
jgi:hypothetical protein